MVGEGQLSPPVKTCKHASQLQHKYEPTHQISVFQLCIHNKII